MNRIEKMVIIGGVGSILIAVSFWLGMEYKGQRFQTAANELIKAPEHNEAFRTCLLERWREGGLIE